ncbi:glyceraldehyde-3-phosphate dehydrogenase [Canibacter zhoujuaniae]|uniref:glyceraldehyde-3-phosphate dehydrogenase n=1 Tax=Canibacter zhoujuaniae TaxID=2708343 RepID=UPI0014220A87|nr:glyceraldehyde-3-phosphate dehydrogenase [Canibacter zhoujuaniae]
MTTTAKDHLESWNTKIALAEELVPQIGKLYRENDVVLSVYGASLVGQSPIEIVRSHRAVRHIEDAELPLAQTAAVVKALTELNPAPVSLDIAKVLREVGTGDVTEYLRKEISNANAATGNGTDVVLYGFGRIGRLLARILIDHTGSGRGLNLRAVVVRKASENDLEKRANLLRRDSVHGPFNGVISIDAENDVIIANGVRIQVIYSNDPATVDYEQYGIKDAIVVDNTGRWRDAEGLSQHLQSKGVARVLLTAPGKGDLKNVVYGINHDVITDDDKIISAASCTTNAITPVLKIVNDAYGVTQGHVETVHSYTNDQNLIDNFHKGDRRGRGAALNMVITETGAAKAVAKALPEFAGKLSGSAIRVPTPDVSLAILNLQLEKDITREEINSLLQEVSLTGELRSQINYVESPEIVSTDFVGERRAGIVDGLATQVSGKTAILYVWYDNEFGYSSQVVRVIEKMAGNHPAHIPAK